MERRFFGLIAVRDEVAKRIDEEVDHTTVAGVFDLPDILELIDDGAFVQQ